MSEPQILNEIETAASFNRGNYAQVALVGSPEAWQTYAAKGVIGQYELALAGLDRFAGAEARLFEGVAHWIGASDESAVKALRNVDLLHAKQLLQLISKSRIFVLSQLARGGGSASDILRSEVVDGRFSIRNIGFSGGDVPNRPYANIHDFYDSANPPDFYICGEIEWPLIPSNLSELPCPVFGRTADFDLHIQNIHPWLGHFDELIVNDHDSWVSLAALTSQPIASCPTGYGVDDRLPELRAGPRPLDLYFSGTLLHPYHPDKAELFHKVAAMSVPNQSIFVLQDGFQSREAYLNCLQNTKICFGYVRFHSALPTRNIEALSMGAVSLVPEGNILNAWVGPSEGLLTYRPNDSSINNVILDVLNNWRDYEQCALRGAKVIRRAFSSSKVMSQFLRFLSFLATKPRISHRQAVSDRECYQKRGIFNKGWLLPQSCYESLLEANSEKLIGHYSKEAQPRFLIDLSRDAQYLYAWGVHQPILKQFNLPMQVRGSLLNSSIKLLDTCISNHPRALVARFNLIRLLLHFGNNDEGNRAKLLAKETLGMPATSWQVGFFDDVMSWDYFSNLFNYRKYFDTLVKLNSHGSELRGTGELVNLLLASIHFYSSFFDEAYENLNSAVKLDGDFPIYQYMYAAQLLIEGKEYNVAGDILERLVTKSMLFRQALVLLRKLWDAGRCQHLDRASIERRFELISERTKSLIAIGDDWCEFHLRGWYLDSFLRRIEILQLK